MKIDRTRLFDKRVVQRNIRAGRVTKDEYRAWLKDLPNATEKIMARDDGGDDDGYDIVPRAAQIQTHVVHASVSAPLSGGAAPGPMQVAPVPAAVPAHGPARVAPSSDDDVPAPARVAPSDDAVPAPVHVAPSSGDVVPAPARVAPSSGDVVPAPAPAPAAPAVAPEPPSSDPAG